jgi:hypothetical protein
MIELSMSLRCVAVEGERSWRNKDAGAHGFLMLTCVVDPCPTVLLGAGNLVHPCADAEAKESLAQAISGRLKYHAARSFAAGLAPKWILQQACEMSFS